MRKAVALLSGGLDSATAAALAVEQGYAVYALSFDYQQRHRRELESAEQVGRTLGVREHQIISFDLRKWGGSALTSGDLEVPLGRRLDELSAGIPVTTCRPETASSSRSRSRMRRWWVLRRWSLR